MGALSPSPETGPRQPQAPPLRWSVGRLAFPAIAAAVSAVFLVHALGLGFGTLQTPGAGLWPFSIAIITIVLAVIQTVLPSAPGSTADAAAESRGRPHIHALALGVMMIGCAFLVDLVGYLPLTAALVFAAAVFVARARWWSAALTALISAGLVYTVFSAFLGIPLPAWPAF